MAIPFGLILNELVTNAIKHAFPGIPKGRVTVRLTRTAREILIEVEDDGVGLPENVSAGEEALGLRLVRLLTQQIKGIVGFERTVPGTRATVRVSLPASTDERKE
jgi:two-component sensor histidine kinase